MLDDDHRDAELAIDCEQQIPQPVRFLDSHARHRLVQKKQLGA